MDVVDWTLIAQVGAVVTAIMQFVKVKKPFNQLDGEYLAMGMGIVIALYFCMMTQVTTGWEWQEWVRCAVSGLVAGAAASGAYNVQKSIAFPNVFPTKTEKTTTK